MADANSLVLRVADWLPPGEWDKAPDAKRRRLLDFAGERAKHLKRKQIRLGIGADGKRLAAVNPKSRPDGATGKPLDPHYAKSRSVRWLRDSRGVKSGTITVWWSHGFGRIIGYHADGLVIGAYIRNVREFPKAYLAELERDVARFWKTMKPARKASPPRQPPPAAPASVPLPMPPSRPIRVPAAARPAIVLPPRSTHRPPPITPPPSPLPRGFARRWLDRILGVIPAIGRLFGRRKG